MNEKNIPIRRVSRRRRLSLALLPMMAAACTGQFSGLPPASPLGRDIEAISPATLDEVSLREPFEEPAGSLNLSQSLAAALRASPELESYAWRVRADEARTLQAGLLPNPALAIEGENFAGSGEFRSYDSAETTVFLGQLVELGGKRVKRRRVAMLERELSGWDYEAARLDVLTRTTQRFVAVLATQQRFRLAQDLLGLANESLEATRARVRAGAASAVEEARSKVELATLQVVLDRRRAELEAARRQLASSWGITTPRFSEAEGNLAELRALPNLEEIARKLSHNPDLARWVTEASRRDAQLELARAKAVPDVTAGLGVRRLQDSNDTALLFGLEIPIPLFDRNQGAAAAAVAEAGRTRALARASQLEVSRELIAAHADASSSYSQARSLRDDVLPQAEAAFEGTRDGYRRGLFRYVDVLDAQRTLFEAKGEYVDALGRYHTATAEIERLVGASMKSLAKGKN